MKRIKLDDIDKVIQHTLDYEIINNFNHIQIEIEDPKNNKVFLEYCKNLTNHIFIDALGGKKAPDGVRRYSVNKSFDEVIKYSETGIACGIKVVHTPIVKFHEWEKGTRWVS